MNKRTDKEFAQLLQDYKDKQCPIRLVHVETKFGFKVNAKIYCLVLDDYKACAEPERKQMCSYFSVEYIPHIEPVKIKRSYTDLAQINWM